MMGDSQNVKLVTLYVRTGACQMPKLIFISDLLHDIDRNSTQQCVLWLLEWDRNVACHHDRVQWKEREKQNTMTWILIFCFNTHGLHTSSHNFKSTSVHSHNYDCKVQQSTVALYIPSNSFSLYAVLPLVKGGTIRRCSSISLTRCSVVALYGAIQHGHHWLKWFPVAWKHKIFILT